MLLSKVTSPLDSTKNEGNVDSVEIAIVDQSRTSKNPISRNTNEFTKPPLELKLSDDEQEDGDGGGSARAETPIHPNQVVDGINFMQVQDPTYIAAELFDHCDSNLNIFSTQPVVAL